MESLSNFLKVSLYRVIFVLLVGIPALELLSYTTFNNFIILKVENIRNSSINEAFYPKINLRTNDYHKLSEKTISNKEIKQHKMQNIGELHYLTINLNGKYKLISFRKLPLIGYIIYLLLALIIGEVLCFIGESFIGTFLFNWNPFYESENLEYVLPWGGKEKDYLKMSDIINLTNIEISEVHYVISRVFAGLVVLLTILFVVICKIDILYILLMIILITIIKSINVIKKETRFENMLSKNMLFLFWITPTLIPYVIYISTKSFSLAFLSALTIISTIMTITYRTHANKLLKVKSKMENNFSCSLLHKIRK